MGKKKLFFQKTTALEPFVLENYEQVYVYDPTEAVHINGVDISDDGKYFYIFFYAVGQSVVRYELNTNFEMDSVTAVAIKGLFTLSDGDISPDGGRMIVARSKYGPMYQYTLTTPYDPTTASGASSVSFGRPIGLKITHDGSLMFLFFGDNTLKAYSLSTPRDIFSATLLYTDTVTFVSAYDMDFNPDGTKCFMCDKGGSIYEYSLSTPYDTRTKILLNTKYFAGVVSLKFSLDGKNLYTSDNSTKVIRQYKLK